MRAQMQSLLRYGTTKPKPLKSILLIIALVGSAHLVQALINHIVDRQLVFFLIVPAVYIAWRFGAKHGILTALVSVVTIDFFLFKPYFAFDIGNKSDLITLAAYLSITLPAVVVFSRLAKKTRLLDLAQNELEMTLRSIGDAVLVVDHNRTVAFMNPVAEKLTGWSLESARGKSVTDVFHIINETTRLQAFNPIEKVLEEGRVVGLANHTVLISKTGAEYQIEDSAAPIQIQSGGDVAGVVLVFRDVTEKYQSDRKTVEALHTLEAAISELADGVIFVDADGGNVRMNRAALEMHGFKSEAELYRHIEQYKVAFKLFDLDQNPLPIEEWPVSRVLRGERFADLDVIVSRPDIRHSFMASYSGTPVTDANGKVKLAVFSVRDVSKRKETEAELMRAKSEAESASHLKTSFLANMSHEIRTPMTAVLGFTEVLKDPKLSDSERADAIQRIEKSGKSLLRLIDDILDVSKVEAGKIEVINSRFYPVEVAAEVVNLLRIQAGQNNIQVNLNVKGSFPEVAYSDPTRVRQILMNLVGNAIKFTTAGHVELCLSAEGDYLIFDVTDTGIGIAPNQQEKLFQPFSQADVSIKRKFGGTGLGLMLAREVATALGGSVTLVESKQGHGSKFRARIFAAPFDRVLSDKAHLEQAAKKQISHENFEGKLRGIKILVAEDVLDNQALLQIYLKAAGADHIEFAGNGEEAIEKASRQSFDIILMDIQMPEMDGITATQTLRKRGYTGPIVALTAHAMQDEVTRTLNAGCDGHIAKPIEKATLIQSILEYARSGKEA